MATIHKNCGPVPGQNSLDAEIGGCAMLMDNLNRWVTKRVNGNYVLQWCLQPICMLHFSVECSARVLWVSSGSGVRCFEVRVVCGRGSGHQSVKIDIGLPVASVCARVDSVTSDCCGTVRPIRRFPGRSDDGVCVEFVSSYVGS